MAIINTLQKCLDSPYLFEDKEAPTRIVELLAKAGDRLEAAANVHTSGQGDPADVVFLSYEAMFSCVRALVYAKGYREFGLRCLLLACENLYVRTGQLDGEHLRKFELAQRLKMSPAEAVEASSAFVKRTRVIADLAKHNELRYSSVPSIRIRPVSGTPITASSLGAGYPHTDP